MKVAPPLLFFLTPSLPLLPSFPPFPSFPHSLPSPPPLTPLSFSYLHQQEVRDGVEESAQAKALEIALQKRGKLHSSVDMTPEGFLNIVPGGELIVGEFGGGLPFLQVLIPFHLLPSPHSIPSSCHSIVSDIIPTIARVKVPNHQDVRVVEEDVGTSASLSKQPSLYPFITSLSLSLHHHPLLIPSSPPSPYPFITSLSLSLHHLPPLGPSSRPVVVTSPVRAKSQKPYGETRDTVPVIIKVTFRFSSTIVALCSLFRTRRKNDDLMYVLTSPRSAQLRLHRFYSNVRGNKTMTLRRSLKGLNSNVAYKTEHKRSFGRSVLLKTFK